MAEDPNGGLVLPSFLEEESQLWMPEEAEYYLPWDGTEEPTDPGERSDLSDEERFPINWWPSEIERATNEELAQELEKYGSLREPEIARVTDGPPPPPNSIAFGSPSYTDLHPTRFDFRQDVRRCINRIQSKFPSQTFANTYFQHPPSTRKWERVSVDFWAGGRVNGRYAGYRGKPLGKELGWRVFRAMFRDEHLPNIAWIIWWGRRWQRYAGWGPAPHGPAGSDAGHFRHVHCTYML